MGTLGFAGSIMQGIENQGYFLSFLIQDGLGMTLPRIGTGLYRDKEITGKYNFKEAKEVALREGLTGPFMMAVAPFMVWFTGKFCKSASVNSRLIKVTGDNFKEMLRASKFSEAIKNDKEAFKKEFYKLSLDKLYKDTVPNDKNSKETLEYIYKEFDKFVNGKKRDVRNEALNNIVDILDEKTIQTSSDLSKLCGATMEVGGKSHVFAAKDYLEAIKNFGIDAIEQNKNFNSLDETAVENIKNNFATKRLLFNVGAVATTLGGLSILPKIYAFSDIAPGATHLVERKEEMKKNKETDGSKNVTFRKKGINSENQISKIGKFIHNKVPNWMKQEFEYNGINFTPTLMACLSLFGLLLPRSLRAYNRAYVDENGKRDMSELHEIWLRDSISSLAVVYTVPILQKLFVSTIEKYQGFVLTNRASDRFIDKINPYSKLKLLSNKELQALYGNIDSKEKMLNFIKFIDKKGGDLQKILSSSQNAKDIFNDKTFTLESIVHEATKDKNKKIISFFEKLDDNASTKELISKLMKDAGKNKQGSIVKMARGLNSIPGFLSTVIISPVILGVLIPMITYSNTRKAHAKMVEEN